MVFSRIHARPHDRHRRAVRCRQGHGRACRGRGARVPSRRQRRDVPRGRLAGGAGAASRSRTSRPWPVSPSARASRSSRTPCCIDGADVTRAIRTPEIDRAAAAVARLPRVRAELVARQREMGAAGGIVMEGRDIGTVVFPGADVKIYLDASPEERARRRALDPAHSGGPTAVADVATALTARDELDRTRAASPLYAAPDASRHRHHGEGRRAGGGRGAARR